MQSSRPPTPPVVSSSSSFDCAAQLCALRNAGAARPLRMLNKRASPPAAAADEHLAQIRRLAARNAPPDLEGELARAARGAAAVQMRREADDRQRAATLVAAPPQKRQRVAPAPSRSVRRAGAAPPPPIAAAVVPRAPVGAMARPAPRPVAPPPPRPVDRRMPPRPVELSAAHVMRAPPAESAAAVAAAPAVASAVFSTRVADKHAAWQAGLRDVLARSDDCTRAMLAPATALNALDTAVYLSQLKEHEVRLLDTEAQAQIREFRRRAKEVVLSSPALRHMVAQKSAQLQRQPLQRADAAAAAAAAAEAVRPIDAD